MRKSLFLFFVAATIFAGCKNNNIAINGKLINPQKGQFIYLDELRSERLITVDSVKVSADGTFKIARNIKSPSFYLLKTDQSNFLTMLIEPGQNINLKSYFDSLNYPIVLNGSKGTELMAEYNRKLRSTIKELSNLREVYIKNLGSTDLASVMDKLDSTAQIYLNNISAYTKKYIDDNISSLVSLVALYQQVAPGEYILHPKKDVKYFVKVDSSLWLNYPDYEPVKSLHDQIQEMLAEKTVQPVLAKAASENGLAPDISLPNPEGDTIKLSSTRGNIVLLDFWAAWCKPCREENAEIVKAFSRWHSRGFQVFQVSLDKTREDWMTGIKDDHLERWIHVSDLKYWSSVVVTAYSIESIPANYLLDREGKIIAVNLRGEALQKKLSEIFNN
jgi:peroxiredoxin